MRLSYAYCVHGTFKKRALPCSASVIMNFTVSTHHRSELQNAILSSLPRPKYGCRRKSKIVNGCKHPSSIWALTKSTLCAHPPGPVAWATVGHTRICIEAGLMKLIGWRAIPSELIGPCDMRRGASSPEEEEAAASILNRSSAFSKTSSENRYGVEGVGWWWHKCQILALY
jgi:hypothetical protein